MLYLIMFITVMLAVIKYKENNISCSSISNQSVQNEQCEQLKEKLIKDAKEIINLTQKQEVRPKFLHPHPFEYIDNATKFYIDRKWVHVFQYVITKPIVYTNSPIK